MDIVVTGANGFLGRHLVHALERAGHLVLPITRSTSSVERSSYLRRADAVYHVAGVNRPERVEEFTTGNVDLTEAIATELLSYNPVPVFFASSIQATQDNPYGNSKREAEDILRLYGQRSGAPVHIYRLPNLFGKWGRPFYNSAVTTFCYQIARGEDITVTHPNHVLTLAHVDDVVASFVGALHKTESTDSDVPTHQITLFDLARMIESFEAVRMARGVPDVSDPFTKKLYSTYLSYLPKERMVTPLLMHQDVRGSFTELFKTPDRGQVSVNVAKPGITKGEHWHESKHEQFIVVSGEGVIRLRLMDQNQIISFHVSEEQLEVIEIPPGYVHHIENTGVKDLVTVMWVNEPFDASQPDTYPATVAQDAEVS
ncbi:NAD-dependent epimerase/dehydratase family protein [Exiguobacterium profundum]|uniref:polysaccharide biosynthesis C-terminal domain-containing protein n=1 Tax=Exiguobacterium TaxID=33986 RepID=UPI001BFCCE94|nr:MULTISPECIES: NAD-dependent epimerase/dehydratase family protein [Exiguobacterium]MCT4798281.1 NAD-dependent epimerase/dehydratase family protein [Exiguobacterium profundum]